MVPPTRRIGPTGVPPLPFLLQGCHCNPNGRFRPYIGAGPNYTTFLNVNTKGTLDGTNLNLDDSWGPAGQIGAEACNQKLSERRAEVSPRSSNAKNEPRSRQRPGLFCFRQSDAFNLVTPARSAWSHKPLRL
ncbi:MAG: OmpW family protein [Gammaproteobacteria bacterium]|nr:OmpW family protein [Gammaproteobacteria bacterium]